MTHVHARIQTFLQQRTAPSLQSSARTEPDAFYNKAGVIPYINSPERRFLVMKPVAKHPHLPPPAYQLCKGTRMQCLPTGWVDIAEGSAVLGIPETLLATALREGIEELGLTLEAITQLHDVGPYMFASTKVQNARHMWLFTAELSSENALLPMEEVADSTAERSWMTAAEFAQQGRGDHTAILQDIAAKLEAK